MELSEVTKRCRLACEAEAVSMGFSSSTGADMFYGHIKHDIENWSLDTFMLWVVEMQSLHGRFSRTGERLIDLYNKCHEIVVSYGKVAKETVK